MVVQLFPVSGCNTAISTSAKLPQELLSLTESTDCPCYGGFGCRRGDGACEDLARQWAGAGEETWNSFSSPMCRRQSRGLKY